MFGTCLESDLNKPTEIIYICDNKGKLCPDWIFSGTKNYFYFLEVIMLLSYVNEFLQSMDTDWNTYRWNDVMFRGCFKIIQWQRQETEWTVERRLVIHW